MMKMHPAPTSLAFLIPVARSLAQQGPDVDSLLRPGLECYQLAPSELRITGDQDLREENHP